MAGADSAAWAAPILAVVGMSDTPIYDEVCAVLLFTPDPPAAAPARATRPVPRPPAQTGEWFRAPADVQATQMIPAVTSAGQS